jgi:hypothetical protein
MPILTSFHELSLEDDASSIVAHMSSHRKRRPALNVNGDARLAALVEVGGILAKVPP